MLVSRVRRTIVSRGLIPRRSLVLCACSGGPDSAAMLATLARLREELGFSLAAVSLDHGLRPEAARDVALAAAQADRVGVPFHALGIQVAPGPGIQARAREGRYQALLQLAQRLGASRVAVGHTQDDQAETVLSRILRGAGLPGLGAIRPLRADGVIRPLIDCRREAVHRFARHYFEEVAEDASNQDPRFERVRIRSHVAPVLTAEDPALVRHLAELADDARDCIQLVDQLAEALLSRVQLDAKTLDIARLQSEPRSLRRAVLRRFVLGSTGQRVGRAELAQLDQTVCSGRGEVWLAQGHSLRAAGEGHLRASTQSRPDGQNG
jgi:tRNA(Ile)-lysidine synthase